MQHKVIARMVKLGIRPELGPMDRELEVVTNGILAEISAGGGTLAGSVSIIAMPGAQDSERVLVTATYTTN